MSASGASLRARATSVVNQLRSSDAFDGVRAVVVFGSVARGEIDAQSDLDLLVVVDDDQKRRLVAEAIAGEHPFVITATSLLDEATNKPSFVAHLVDEGRVVYERGDWPALRDELASKVTDPEALEREIRRRARHLEPLAAIEHFRNSPVTAMSQIYGVARSLVIARLLELGVHEYSWRRAFDRYAELRPDLRGDLEALKGLRPYYEFARGRRRDPLPDAEVGVPEMRRMLESAARLGK